MSVTSMSMNPVVLGSDDLGTSVTTASDADDGRPGKHSNRDAIVVLCVGAGAAACLGIGAAVLSRYGGPAAAAKARKSDAFCSVDRESSMVAVGENVSPPTSEAGRSTPEPEPEPEAGNRASGSADGAAG